MNWLKYVQEMNKIPGWDHYVVPTWKKYTEYTLTHLLDYKGRMRDDFLIACDDRGYSVLGTWGAVTPARDEHVEFYKGLHIDWDRFADPERGGLREWSTALDASENLKQHVSDDAGKFLTALNVSPTTIVQVRAIFLAHADSPFIKLDGLVHWGAGIGNHSRILRLMGLKTEYIIDLPVATAVQYEYLSHVFPGEVILVDGTTELEEGKINIVPLPFVDRVPDQELFIALHSLNESTVEAQKMVVEDRKWFGAKNCFLSWTEDLTDHDGNPFGPGISHWRELIDTSNVRPVGPDWNLLKP